MKMMFGLFYPVPYYVPFLVWDALQPPSYFGACSD
jgi:hypothetical protein